MLPLFSPILTLFPSLKPKHVFQSLFYITLAFLAAVSLYSIGIIVNRILDLENSQSAQKKLQDNVDSLNKKIKELKERNHNSQNNVSFTTSEKAIDKLASSSKNVSTITETFTHTITVNNDRSEELPEDNKTKLNEKGA